MEQGSMTMKQVKFIAWAVGNGDVERELEEAESLEDSNRLEGEGRF